MKECLKGIGAVEKGDYVLIKSVEEVSVEYWLGKALQSTAAVQRGVAERDGLVLHVQWMVGLEGNTRVAVSNMNGRFVPWVR